MPKKFDLDTTLLQFTGEQDSANFTIRDAVEGIQIFGGIGSGKTSGSGQHIALKFLQHGFGGLVLTAKISEVDLWIEYCRETNRTNDLIIVEPGGNHYFNFLEYESNGKSGLSYTDNIFQVLKTVIDASDEGSKGKGDDQFWQNAMDLFVSNVINLCLLAYNKVTVKLLFEIAQSAPRKGEKPVTEEPKKGDTEPPTVKMTPFKWALKAARDNVKIKIDNFQRNYPPDKFAQLSAMERDRVMNEGIPDFRMLHLLGNFFVESLYNIGEKTRSIIHFSFTGFLFRMLRDPIYTIFCSHPSTFTPEDSLDGKIIVINLPVKLYQKVGRDSQLLFKYVWQRAMERRNTNENERPVFLWADEAQHFLHKHDTEYQATARSSRISTVYLSQNLPNYYANMDSAKSDYLVKSFLGTLATKIFHANADTMTNQYASELIGEAYQKEESEAHAANDGKVSVTKNISSVLRKMVRPEEFAILKTGGPLNDRKVTGFICIQGKRLANRYTSIFCLIVLSMVLALCYSKDISINPEQARSVFHHS